MRGPVAISSLKLAVIEDPSMASVTTFEVSRRSAGPEIRELEVEMED
jgi:hypothetical protein